MKPWRGPTSARRRPTLLVYRPLLATRPRSRHLRWLERRLPVTNRPSSTRRELFYQRPRRRRAGAACACVFVAFLFCVDGAVAPLTAPCFCSQPLCPRGVFVFRDPSSRGVASISGGGRVDGVSSHSLSLAVAPEPRRRRPAIRHRREADFNTAPRGSCDNTSRFRRRTMTVASFECNSRAFEHPVTSQPNLPLLALQYRFVYAE